MPLKRFKSGDFESPLQLALGAENVVRITPHGKEETSPNPASESANTIAKSLANCIYNDEISLLKSYVERHATTTSIDLSDMPWNEEGEVYFAEQAADLEAASTYAYWLGHQDQFPQFEVADLDDIADHPVWDLDGEASEFPHLVFHDMYVGYYLPGDFPDLIRIPTKLPGTNRMLGSSFRLREELKSVGKTLGLAWQNQLGLVDERQQSRDELHSIVVEALEQLSRAAVMSCAHGLPIIFDG